MQESSSPGQPTADAAEERLRQETLSSAEPRNLVFLAAHNVVMRTAWIFKTESVIVPALIDAVSGAAWVRAWLPLLNRTAQSVPPFFLAEGIRQAPRKRWPLALTSFCMGAPLLAIAALWARTSEPRPGWMTPALLGLYFLFFVCTGLNQLTFQVVQGKLLPAERRGRLLGWGGVIGSIGAVTCAFLLLARWLSLPDQGFTQIFLFAGLGFAAAGLFAAGLREPADAATRGGASAVSLRSAWRTLREDAAFRRLAWIAMLFMGAQMLFPHYQALGRERLKVSGLDLTLWIVVQNVSVGIFSSLAGLAADRWGNRCVLRRVLFGIAATPLAALGLASGRLPGGGLPFLGVFFLLGLAPVAYRTFTNYALELAPPAEHPRYMATLNLCFAIPYVFSAPVGLLIDLTGFAPVFICMACVVGVGGLLTLGMSEPRTNAAGLAAAPERPVETAAPDG